MSADDSPEMLLPTVAGGVAVMGLSGNFQKITATGDVVMYDTSAGASQAIIRRIEGALNKAAAELIEAMPRNSSIAVLSVSSTDRQIAEYVVDELELQFVNSNKFTIVDRRRLDQIRNEQNFQMSGDVDDNSAVSIGKMLGATIVITGDISGLGSSQRLVLRAMDVRTGQIIKMAREQF